MTTTSPGAPVPELLEACFAACVASGDVEGIVQLYAADAVVSLPRGREAAGSDAIRSAFAAALASAALGVRSACASRGVDEVARSARAIVSGDLAMTTSTAPDGTVHTQVARREGDGSWVWIRDGSRLRDVEACCPAVAASGMSEAVA